MTTGYNASWNKPTFYAIAKELEKLGLASMVMGKRSKLSKLSKLSTSKVDLLGVEFRDMTGLGEIYQAAVADILAKVKMTVEEFRTHMQVPQH